MGNFPLGNAGTGQLIQTTKNETKTLSVKQALVGHESSTPDAVAEDNIVPGTAFIVGATGATIAAQPDVPRALSLTGDSLAVAAGAGTTEAVIVGTDVLNESITATLTAIDGTVEGIKAFKSITSITINTAEIYTLDLDTPSAGTYLLGNAVNGFTTPIAYDANDATILAALKVAYGAANIISVTSLEIVGLMGQVLAMELDGAGLTDAGAETLTVDTAPECSIGVTNRLGLKIAQDNPTLFRVSFDGANVIELADDGSNTRVWAQTVDSSVISNNIFDPGDTVSDGFDASKILDLYYLVPA